MKLVNIKVRKEDVVLSHEDLVNILSTATYGSYWFDCRMNASPNLREKLAEKYGDCREDAWAGMLLEGGTIIFLDYYDAEENEEGKPTEYEVTLETFKNGVLLAYNNKENEWIRKGLEDEFSFDLNIAEAFVQLIMFGEVVYG